MFSDLGGNSHSNSDLLCLVVPLLLLCENINNSTLNLNYEQINIIYSPES